VEKGKKGKRKKEMTREIDDFLETLQRINVLITPGFPGKGDRRKGNISFVEVFD